MSRILVVILAVVVAFGAAAPSVAQPAAVKNCRRWSSVLMIQVTAVVNRSATRVSTAA